MKKLSIFYEGICQLRLVFDTNVIISAMLLKQFLTSFILNSTPVEIDEIISEYRDPKDNKFLELAVCGKADFIISGDKVLAYSKPLPKYSDNNPR